MQRNRSVVLRNKLDFTINIHLDFPVVQVAQPCEEVRIPFSQLLSVASALDAFPSLGYTSFTARAHKQ